MPYKNKQKQKEYQKTCGIWMPMNFKKVQSKKTLQKFHQKSVKILHVNILVGVQ